MKIERFEDIEAWQLARELTRKVCRLTKKPGFAKDYGLKSQITQNLEPRTGNLELSEFKRRGFFSQSPNMTII